MPRRIQPSTTSVSIRFLYFQIRRKRTLFSNNADNFYNTSQCTVVWKQCNKIGAEKPLVGIVHSIPAGQSNLSIFVSSSKVISHPTTPQVIQACERRPPDMTLTPRRPHKMAAAAGWRSVSQLPRALVGYTSYSQDSFTRAASISPKIIVTLYPTSHGFEMIRMGRKLF